MIENNKSFITHIFFQFSIVATVLKRLDRFDHLKLKLGSLS